jgi:hypothetical protein
MRMNEQRGEKSDSPAKSGYIMFMFSISGSVSELVLSFPGSRCCTRSQMTGCGKGHRFPVTRTQTPLTPSLIPVSLTHTHRSRG